MGIIQNHNTLTPCTMNKHIALTCISICLLCGCANSFLKPAAGSERVLLMSAKQVTHCQSLGKVNVNVVTKVGIYNRDADAVQANLLQLGQNNAIELGGDTLVKEATPEFGKQIFAVYKCKR
jgi:hypothetical protein